MEGVYKQKILDRDGNWGICDYNKGKLIGRGAYSKCYQFIDNKNGKLFAAKEMK